MWRVGHSRVNSCAATATPETRQVANLGGRAEAAAIGSGARSGVPRAPCSGGRQMSHRGGGSFGGDRRILSIAPRSLVALLIAVLLAFHPSCAQSAETMARHETRAQALALGQAAVDCARPTSGLADPIAPSDRHTHACAICCSIACGGFAPSATSLVYPRAEPAIVDGGAFRGRGARRTESFGRSWSSRAPPVFS